MRIKQDSNIYRCEKKYIISISEYTILSSILKSILQVDSYANSDGNYLVRSLYFDSIDDKDYREKQVGLVNRQKVRLRLYNHNQEMVKLENKKRYGRFMKKDVALITKEDANKLIHSSYECLCEYKDSVIDNIYAELLISKRIPKVIVEYIREAYVHPESNVRINFDKKVARCNQFDLFAEKLPTITFQKDGYYVLEVKYNEYLPSYIQSILSSFNLIETTYSKYLYSRF